MCQNFSEPYIYVDDITNKQENVKISFINSRNFENPLNNVTYIPNNILASDSLAEDFESIPLPCKCKETCGATCPCCLGSNIAYHDGLLLENYFCDTSKPIIECSILCTCKNCPNRVVQSGIKFHLQVFMTEHKGFGVQTLEFIPKCAFVCEYVGELIDKDEAQMRFKKQKKEEANYIYVLNEYSSKNLNICTVIDPTYTGNVGRYLNHSCSPNLIPVPVRANNMIPRICFFAKNDIKPYDELTYNYGININHKICINTLNMKSSFKTEKKCHCNSKKCIGVLPFDATLIS